MTGVPDWMPDKVKEIVAKVEKEEKEEREEWRQKGHEQGKALMTRLGTTPDARPSDPAQSHEAARSVEDGLTERQAAVLYVFEILGPMSDVIFVGKYQEGMKRSPLLYPRQSESGLRTRRHELVEKGKLRPFGTETLPSGRAATVWAVKDYEERSPLT